jgi:cytochrome c oxidase subunit IV
MIMVEKGLTSEEMKAMYMRDVRRDPLHSLKWGLLFVLGGAALMIGQYLHETYYLHEGVIMGLVILCVGIGLLIFYGIAAKRAS